MTTSQMLDTATEYGLFGDITTVYCGPTNDRLTLREAGNNLFFSVNRSLIFTPIGQPTVQGFYKNFADAVANLKKMGKGWRLSAHYPGYGYTEECLISCSYWNLLNIQP